MMVSPSLPVRAISEFVTLLAQHLASYSTVVERAAKRFSKTTG